MISQNKVPIITVVIPIRETDTAEVTLLSLASQTFQDFETIVVPDEGKGANRGFEDIKSEFVLFSDNDINWKTQALETLYNVLQATPRASYAYGRYKLGSDVWSHQPWDPLALKRMNYISTMSLIRTADLRLLGDSPWDESIKRLQDWDLWLSLLDKGKRGVYVDDLIFETPLKEGISHGGQNYLDSILIVRQKHNI